MTVPIGQVAASISIHFGGQDVEVLEGITRLLNAIRADGILPDGAEINFSVDTSTAKQALLDNPISSLELSERPRNILGRTEIKTIGDLIGKSEDDLLAITNMGQKATDEVIEKLAARGLKLKGM